jgi:hypothetical protein
MKGGLGKGAGDMLELGREPRAIGEQSEGAEPREMYMILYPKELEDEIIETLESTGVPGYTEMPKMVGRGRKVRHFDNAVWPGATGCIFTVVTPRQAEATLIPAFHGLADRLEARSHGLYGIHLFALPCQQLI